MAFHLFFFQVSSCEHHRNLSSSGVRIMGDGQF